MSENKIRIEKLECDGLEGFAEACYDTNTFEDLISALESRTADKGDCKQWNLTPTQWRYAIGQALRTKINTLSDYVGEEYIIK